MIGLLFWLSIFTVFYVYAGYPIVVTILARIHAKPIKKQAITPTVTLLIAAYNEELVIEGKIHNSLALDYPKDRLQILIAADGSDDHTVEIVQRFKDDGVELSFAPERRGKMAAITRALRLAHGEIIVFSDANNHYKADTVKILVRSFADPTIGAVSGAKHIIEDGKPLGSSEGLYWKYESFLKKQETRLGSCIGVTGEILAIRRKLFVEPSTQVINDDFYILMQILRQGYRLIYEPMALSYEEVSATAADEIVRRARIIAGRYQAISMAAKLLPWKNPLVVWQIFSHKFLRPFVPVMMILAFLSNLIAIIWPPVATSTRWLWLSSPFNQYLFLLQCLFYLMALLGNVTQKEDWIGKILYLPSFLVNSNFAALIGLFRYLARKQKVTWKKVNRQSNTAFKEP
ncbi:MAG: glycosyltransferase family 2 protein [Anaerolineae bacterium]|nr:glycosyltransferase family 2 protein [Anaerolineae bacterium]